ncbi:MAG: hypothetical protein AAGA23_22485 [Pseudomonadota bacterium]
MKPARIIFLSLLAGCALLTAGIVALWSGFGQTIDPAPPLAAARPGGAGAGASEEFALPGFESFDEVIQRPLFNDDRRPLEPTVTETPTEPGVGEPGGPPAELNVAVTGIIITPQQKLAMVTNNVSKEFLRLKEGMSLDGEQAGWTLRSIEPRRLVFDGGAGTAEVKLETYTQALKGGAPPPRRSAVVTAANDNNKKPEGGNGDNADTPTSDQDRAARAEEIRRRVAERRAQLREEAERRRAEAELDDDED